MTRTPSLQSLIDAVSHVMPRPVRVEKRQGMIVLIGGDPGEVRIRIKKSTISVAMFGTRWEGPHSLVDASRELGKVSLKDLSQSQLLALILPLIEVAKEVRRATFRTCSICQRVLPPEWMHDEQVCQKCAEEKLGVVY